MSDELLPEDGPERDTAGETRPQAMPLAPASKRKGHRKGNRTPAQAGTGPAAGSADGGSTTADPADDEGPRTGPDRRCIVTGVVQPKAALIRFVAGPGDEVVPDLDGSLPGRGLWLSARRDVVETATAKKAFSRAARRQLVVPGDLAQRVEDLLRRRCLGTLGIARRAGLVAAGFDVVKAAAKEGHVVLLLEAADGAEDGRRKVTAAARDAVVVDVFSAAELAAALGRDHVIHVAVSAGKATERALVARLLADVARFTAYRAVAEP